MTMNKTGKDTDARCCGNDFELQGGNMINMMNTFLIRDILLILCLFLK